MESIIIINNPVLWAALEWSPKRNDIETIYLNRVNILECRIWQAAENLLIVKNGEQENL